MNDEWLSLHQILRQLYEEMLPLCQNLIGVARAIAGLGAVFYIANRVWRSLATNEPIDLYPLFRPFVIGFCILAFPLVLATLNGILNPVVQATAALADHQHVRVRQFQEQLARLEEATLQQQGKGWLIDDAAFEQKLGDLGVLDLDDKAGMYTERAMFQIRTSVREWFREVLLVLYEGASLVLDTLRTFFLVVLAIIGPFAFGLSVFDGFHNTLTNWVARYIHVSLWLPVANIFGAIIARVHALLLEQDLAHPEADHTFDTTNTAYLVFLLIGIFGYTCVPTVAGWVVQSCGGGRFIQHITHTSWTVAGRAAALAGATTGAATGLATGALAQAGTAARNLATNPDSRKPES